MPGKLIVISAPSGCGKTTIINEILKIFPDLCFSVSATTRQMRENETNGIEYFFLTMDEFNEKIEKNEFLEWNEHYGNRYGTLKSVVEEELKKGKDILFDLDVNGAMNVKKNMDNAKLIFIKPPSMEVLKERLMKRGTETENSIALRLKRTKEELDKSIYFDYIIINGELENAVEELKHFIDKIKKEN